MYDKNITTAILAGLLTVPGLLGCNEAPQQKANDIGELKVSAIAPSSAAAVEAVLVSVVPSEGGSTVTLTAGPDMPELGELFFEINYDPQNAHSLGLESATGVQDSTGLPERLGLLVEPVPGQIDAGFVTVGGGESAIAPGDLLASFELVGGPTSAKASSEAASNNTARARNLTLNQDGDCNWVLGWDYTNPGDANQDGEVSINDLTPIGAHYQETVADDYEDPLRHIDGDLNGEINLGDITPIGSNYNTEIWAYQIEMSENGQDNFITVGQLILSEQGANAGETLRFSYTFGAQYVEGHWYRVVPLTKELAFGAPSEAVSSAGRMMSIEEVAEGQKFTVTVGVKDLETPITHMNSCRVLYPASFKYVKDSYNCGSPGGARDYVDGLWASFANTVLFPPENFIVEQTVTDGLKCIDFNVTTVSPTLPAAPIGFGDLFNFRLEATGSEPLVLLFETTSEDGIRRTYFSDGSATAFEFGAALGFTVN